MDFLKDIGKYKAIFDSAHNGIVIIDQYGTILIFNKGADRITGKAPNETIGKFFGDIFPNFWPDIKKILETGKPQAGKKLALKNSFIIANRTPIYHKSRVIGVISIFQDISEYEKVLKELVTYKILYEELNTIINSSFDGLWISDHEGTVIRINPASEKISGVTPEQVIGKKMKDLVQEGVVDRSVTLEVLKKKTTITLITKQQTGKHVLTTGNPVFDDQGRIRLVVVNERDLTELHNLRNELEESRALSQRYYSEISSLYKHKTYLSKIVVRSDGMHRVLDMAMKVARVDSTVMILGESGVGKGLFAKLIHQASTRKNGPFIRVDCGSIPESLIESELFGYEAGAFTGALAKGKPGFFELANKGTLFLDEVAETPISLQVKLLRFLEDNELIRVGGIKTRKIDTRVIVATNRNLKEMVNQGRFRKDLFFRMSVVPLIIPPLRERIEDIPHLIYFFLRKFNKQFLTEKTIHPRTLDCLCAYSFPGNIRELANLIERLLVLTPKNNIKPEDLPIHFAEKKQLRKPTILEDEWNLNKVVVRIEKEMIIRALEQFGTQKKTAVSLGIDPSTLSRKIKRYGLISDE